MKKIIMIVLCLVVLMTMAVPAFAAETTAATTAATTTAATTTPTTAPAVEDDAADEAPALTFTPSRFVEMLPNMGIGMLVIFIIIGVIILTTMLINKIFSKKD